MAEEIEKAVKAIYHPDKVEEDLGGEVSSLRL